MQSPLTVGFLLIVLAVIDSSQMSVTPQKVKEKGQIEILTTTGDINVQFDDGRQFELKKVPQIPLGDKVPEEDPDTFRARGNKGRNLVIIEFDSRDNTSWALDGEGYATLDGHMYEIVAGGPIKKTDDKIWFEAKFMKPRDFGEVEGHPGTYGNDEITIPDSETNKNKSEKITVTRATHDHLYMELAILVDKPVWDQFVSKYGNSAETKLQNYIESIVAIANVDYESLDIPITINVPRLLIWKNGALSGATRTYDIARHYLRKIPSSNLDAPSLEVDHVAVISGYRFQYNNLGRAYIGSMCTNPKNSLSVSKYTSETPLADGQVLAHELGHSIGSKHDQVDDNECELKGFLMSPWIVDSELQFSTCSQQYIKNHIAHMDSLNSNCLLNKPCHDINHMNFCVAYGTRYCDAKYTISSSSCIPAAEFPDAAAKGNCPYYEMCRRTCHICCHMFC